ncbi:MAG: PEP-CTERM sorting domain-containing protein [Omnitrophica bacterium]|nr:PEP-CTERM sorting domain-containing protein [Candidatus Omnitrophota bacterium]
MKKIGIIIIGLSLCLLYTSSAHAICQYFDIDIVGTATPTNGSWLYTYTLSIVTEGYDGCTFKEMSHWWLELPEHKIDSLSGFDPTASDTDWTETKGDDLDALLILTTLGNTFDGKHFGVKWNVEDLGDPDDPFITYSFISTHSPVGGGDNPDEGAYTWFAVDGVGFEDYGATVGPNGPNGVIPEPTSLMLLGMGLFGFGGMRKRKNRKKM